MLKLLLDEHISPTVADGLRRRNRLLIVSCMAEWEEGEFLGQQDSACLQQAAAQGLTLVTYDRTTIPPLLKAESKRTRLLREATLWDNWLMLLLLVFLYSLDVGLRRLTGLS